MIDKQAFEKKIDEHIHELNMQFAQFQFNFHAYKAKTETKIKHNTMIEDLPPLLTYIVLKQYY